MTTRTGDEQLAARQTGAAGGDLTAKELRARTQAEQQRTNEQQRRAQEKEFIFAKFEESKKAAAERGEKLVSQDIRLNRATGEARIRDTTLARQERSRTPVADAPPQPQQRPEYVNPRHNQPWTNGKRVGDIINEELAKGDRGLYGSRKVYDYAEVKNYVTSYKPSTTYSHFFVNLGGIEESAPRSPTYGPEDPRGINRAYIDNSFKGPANVRGDILPQRGAGTPIGDTKLKPSDSPLDTLTDESGNLLRFGYEASKGFNPYQIFKDEYESGPFPVQYKETVSSVAFQGGTDTITDAVSGRGFSGQRFAPVADQFRADPVRAAVGVVGGVPYWALPVGSGARAAAGVVRGSVNAVRQSSTVARLGSITTRESTIAGNVMRFGTARTLEAAEPAIATARRAGVTAEVGLFKAGQAAKTGLVTSGQAIKSEFSLIADRLPEVPQPVQQAARYVRVSAELAPYTVAGAARRGAEAVTSTVEPYRYVDFNFPSVRLPSLPDSIVNSSLARQARYAGTSLMLFPETSAHVISSGVRAGSKALSEAGLYGWTSTQMNLFKTGRAISGPLEPYRYIDFSMPSLPRVSTPGFFGDVGRAYRKAKFAESMIRYELDIKPELAIAESRAAKAELARLKALGKTKLAPMRPFDYESEPLMTSKQPRTSMMPLEQINDYGFRQFAPSIIDQAYRASAASVMGTAPASTDPLGLYGYTGAIKKGRRARTANEQYETVINGPIESESIRNYLAQFELPNTRVNNRSKTNLNIIPGVMSGESSRFDQELAPLLTPTIKPMTGARTGSILREDQIPTVITMETNIQTPRIETGQIPESGVTTRTKPPVLPFEWPPGTEKQRRRKRGDNSLSYLYGKTLWRVDPLIKINKKELDRLFGFSSS